MRTFLTRAAVAIVAIPALIYLFYLGDLPLRLFVVALIVLGSYEAWRLFSLAGVMYPLMPMVLLTIAVPFVSASYLPRISWPLWLILVLVFAGFPVIFAKDARRTALGISSFIVTALWLAIGFGAILGIRASMNGQGYRWLLFLFANLWIGDTAAYLFGVWLGKRKLAPVISPKKTIAGATAQIFASIAVAYTFKLGGWIQGDSALLMTAALTIAIVGQLGDLCESALKRAADQKDSSAIIPGHGGVLDRFDSALFAAPSLYALLAAWPR